MNSVNNSELPSDASPGNYSAARVDTVGWFVAAGAQPQANEHKHDAYAQNQRYETASRGQGGLSPTHSRQPSNSIMPAVIEITPPARLAAELLSPPHGFTAKPSPAAVEPVLSSAAARPAEPTARPSNGHIPVSLKRKLLSWRAPADAGLSLARTLNARWETYCESLRSCQRRFSEKAVHDLRVATRRLIAQFVLLECVAPETIADPARRLLKRRLKVLGALRDSHVQRIFIEQQMARFPELLLVRNHLERQERRLVKLVARKIRDFKTRKLAGWTSVLCRDLSAEADDAGAQAALAESVFRATAEAFAKVVERREAIDPARARTIHQTRIAFKKFRYMVESLSPAFTGLNKRQLQALGYYQKRMGNLQDLEVMQLCITDFVDQHVGTEPLLATFDRYLRQRRAHALRAFLKSADQLYAFWPRAADPAQQLAACTGQAA